MNWYVVQTKPRQEKRAEENLINQGFDVFLPMLTVEKLRNGKISKLIEPLFSRYLFVQLDLTTGHWNRIQHTLGVSKLLALGGVPLALPSNLIAVLKTEQNHLINQTGLNTPFERLLVAKDEVLFTQGPLKGFLGVFQEHDGEARALVLVEILSKSHRITVDLSNIVPA